ncbi:OmpA family protein [Streptomyces sp. PSAA01]|uniref:OmpA family protein n=1 Tax=Streptomyces sp. PSAA01 TaxID=2912762 RepID=UPI001F3EC752|nr:OmpA family protein [Streptomyces sp. PSAA01]MCG0288724.1 OmpA family protein [Streptomyces sp. PSAA01]
MSVFIRTTPGKLIALALASAALMAGSGCSAFETPKAQPCAWLDRGSDEADDPYRRTAVLVDRSPSARPDKAAGPTTRVPDWTATLLGARELELSRLEGGALSVAAFDGTRATVDWEVDRVSVTPVKGNDKLREDRRAVRRGCLEKRLRRISDEAPSTGSTDVLGALAAAAAQFGPGGGERRIVMATDGLTNAGCADLRSAGFDGTTEIGAVVDRCREAGELPDLTGVEVDFFGIGRAARGKAPSSPQTAWLTALWTRLCRASGASDCRVAPARTRDAGRATTAVKPEPEVTFPAVSERPAGRVTTITLPGSVLFATDRAELSPTAQDTLDDAARRIRDLHPVSVAVSGHTDSRGSEQRGKQLSLARAQAVRSALAQRGIDVISARGYSDERPSCTPEYRGGVPDYRAMACNRRVEIAVTVRR